MPGGLWSLAGDPQVRGLPAAAGCERGDRRRQYPSHNNILMKVVNK